MPTPPPAPHWTPLPPAIHTLVESTPNAILLETSRFDAANRHSYLFLEPTRILTATTPAEIPTLFSNIEAALAEGLHLAGYLSYECAAHFEPTTARAPEPNAIPLAHLGAYPAPLLFDHATGRFLDSPPSRVPQVSPLRPGFPQLPAPEPNAIPLAHLGAYPAPLLFDHATGRFLDAPTSRVPQVSPLRPGFPQLPAPPTHTSPVLDHPTLRIPTPDYLAAIEKIKAYIAAGDTYQVNFTDAITFPTNLSPATLFTALSAQQTVAYGAFLNVASHHILSLSPELFFRVDTHDPGAPTITTRPMKGTMPRGLDAAEDALAALALQRDEKNRAEHVMIVDLLRNDLGRISLPGTVHVDDLFSIERYQTLLQMTSTISATLRPRTSFYEIFRAMFPCGSITGAPKIRTMQIIRELEAHPRGIYTGAIGHIAPDRSATFSVAIRTLVLRNHQAHMGVGGGIVADSIPADEHRECLLKASFLTRPHQPFELIETLLFDQDYIRLPLHLDRLESSAAYFDFLCDRASIASQLQHFAHSLHPAQRHRIRLLLAPSGTLTLTSQPLVDDSPTLAVRLSLHRVSSTDPFLRHKTTRRSLYDQELAAARAEGFDEVLFRNECNELTEGTISNLFLESSGKMFTPPLTSGVLPGVLRRYLLETLPNAEERVLTLADLEPPNTLWLCSSLRGLRRVTSVYPPSPPEQLA